MLDSFSRIEVSTPFLSRQKIFRCEATIARKARLVQEKIASRFYFFARGHGVVTHLQFCVTTCSHKPMKESEKVAVPNREAVKVLAQAIGVREAARRMGLSEERVMKWSQRDPSGPWMSQPGAAMIAAPSVTGATRQLSACPQPVRSASEALADVNAENGARSRSAALRYSARGLEHLADLPPDEGVLLAAQAASLTKVAATAGEWSSASRGNVRINILAADPFAQVSIEGSSGA